MVTTTHINNKKSRAGKTCLLIAFLSLFTMMAFAGNSHAWFWSSSEEDATAESEETATDTATDSETKTASNPESNSAASATTITDDEAWNLLRLLDEKTRSALLANPAAFGEYFQKELERKALLKHAKESDFYKNQLVQFALNRNADQIIINNYLQDAFNRQKNPAYPSEADIVNYYNANIDKYSTKEKIEIFQIFYGITPQMTEQDIFLLQKKAAMLVVQLRKKKLTFDEAAKKESEHPESRMNGGYSGVFNVADLLPELKTATQNLSKGGITDPIRRPNGIYILMVGERTPAQLTHLKDVQQSIRDTLLESYNSTLMQQIINNVSNTNKPSLAPSTRQELYTKLRQRQF